MAKTSLHRSPAMALPTYSLDALLDLYRDRGHAQYGGEAVSQLEHALQCATLAEQAGQSAELITASLFHDLGHLIHHLGEDAVMRGIDDRHEFRAIPVLQKLFPAAVTTPIRLHVEAKRYLCFAEPDYWDSLSTVSQQTLQLQGGIFSSVEAQAFIRQPYAESAVTLRRWDEQAKVAGQQTPALEHFVPILQASVVALVD